MLRISVYLKATTLMLIGGLAIAGCDRVNDVGKTAAVDEVVEDAVVTEDGFAPGEDIPRIDETVTTVVERSGDPATDDAAYLAHIGMMRGHLIAFIELYREGELEMAAVHAKHPGSELYQELVPAIEARGLNGFANELVALGDAVSGGGDVEAAYTLTQTAITGATPIPTTKIVLYAVSDVMHEAAKEYELAVNDAGEIVNAHEYQDAYGFLAAARELVAELQTDDIQQSDAINFAYEQIDVAVAQTGSLLADASDGDAETIAGAASLVERIANRL